MKNRKHILVVDDVTANLKCMGELLKEEYILSMAKSGEQALQVAEKIHPDLILLDVKMPGMDGYETLEKLNNDPLISDIPVIFITADRENESKIRGLKLGAKDFIRKPYVPEIMLGRISNCLEQEERNRAALEQAMKDPVTGLWLPKYIKDEADRLLLKGQSGSLILICVNGAPDNGSKEGIKDENLICFASALKKFVHKDDIVARTGDLRFAVFLKNASGKDILSSRIESLIRSVEKELKPENGTCAYTSFNIGIASAPGNGSSFDELADCAEKALALSEKEGSGCFRFSDENEN